MSVQIGYDYINDGDYLWYKENDTWREVRIDINYAYGNFDRAELTETNGRNIMYFSDEFKLYCMFKDGSLSFNNPKIFEDDYHIELI